MTTNGDDDQRANDSPVDRALVSQALNRLQPLDREVLRRAKDLGWTTDRIAVDLHLAEPVVKSQLHSALHTLRQYLADPPNGEGFTPRRR
ncbi:sigma factor-like helix-turn-helix DNA-binding protein [Mycolicibacterium sp. P9-64]|uniref:sigma factor-like helix-turn-helix DNA-binding protein n=1 Tax=Mycolicibacterium sp. P9-64 TaxID=2024612 RepID=UPI00156313D2|nr:sigma factor-like helix-turn-helix DNA-binding protein [Mycolicibacterium sp. P9-64]